MKKCPFCSEEIQDEAIKCIYCGEITNITEIVNNEKVIRTLSCKSLIEKYNNKQVDLIVDVNIRDKIIDEIKYSTTLTSVLGSTLFGSIIILIILSFKFPIGINWVIFGIILIVISSLFGIGKNFYKPYHWFLPLLIISLCASYVFEYKRLLFITIFGIYNLLSFLILGKILDNVFLKNEAMLFILRENNGLIISKNGKILNNDEVHIFL